MLYKGFHVGVFYAHRQWMDNWIIEFRRKIGDENIALIAENDITKYKIVLRDKTIIRGIDINQRDNLLGFRFDKAYVEPCLNDNIIGDIIKPLMVYESRIVKDV